MRDVHNIYINYIMIMIEPIISIVPGMITNNLLKKSKLINFSDNAKDLPPHIINLLPNASK